MKFASLKTVFGLMCVALATASTVQASSVAVPINDLYNTGMATPWNAAQSPLPGSNPGSVGDPHWTVFHDPAGSAPYGQYGTKTLVDSGAPFLGNQFNRAQLDLAADPNRVNTNVDNSQWVSSVMPASNGTQTYIFQTTFTTSNPLTSISISGFFKAAEVIGISLNGGPLVNTGFPLASSGNQQTPLKPATAFTITGTGGLTNTLSFYVNRPGGTPSYLRVEFTNAAFTVPEPSSIVLGALGLVGFGATRLRRRFFGTAKAN